MGHVRSCIAILLLSACKDKKPPPIEVFDSGGVPAELLQVVVNGEPVEVAAAVAGQDGNGIFTGMPRLLLPDEHAKIKVGYVSPCGTVIDSGLAYRHASSVLEVDRRVTTTSVLVDNRGRGATKVSLGPATFTVAAGAVAAVRIAGWTCGPRPIRIDGTEVGTIGPDERNDERSSVLIDPSGTRCYRVDRKVYAESYERLNIEPFKLELRGSKVYATPSIHEVFKELPTSSSSRGSRYNLTEC